MKRKTGFVFVWLLFGFCAGAAELTPSPVNGVEVARRVALSYMKRHPVESLDWGWQDAVFLYGLDRLKSSLPAKDEDRRTMVRYLAQYQESWRKKGIPTINRSDVCPSALAALSLARVEGEKTGLEAAGAVAEYVSKHPRNRLGALNHLGSSWMRWFYPNSIWVDSLMMYAVFAAQWADFRHDLSLLKFAARQPLIFADQLQDPATGLFRHAYLLSLDSVVPKEEAFWLRGNGWVLVSIAEILDAMGEEPTLSYEREQLLTVFRRLSGALMDRVSKAGDWPELLMDCETSRPESSGTALVAAALLRGAQRGWLEPARARAVGNRALARVAAQVEIRPDGASVLTGISGPTNAFPKWFYLQVSHEADLAYGVGAFLMAAAEAGAQTP